ncbi:MAG: sigma-70 family RNA polymerase sigma factor [Nitriliruptor sp.]|nr:MAG: sigma-70 family RNA polymerase sigma factor [Nitriliruptor sp.]
MTLRTTAAAPAGLDEAALEGYRRELSGYCYRMLGSLSDAEDAAQETLVRAWRAADRFEGRSSLRTWLYRIATNVCLDELDGRQRRVRPMDLTEPSTVAEAKLVALPDGRWLEPAPDGHILPQADDPAEQAALRQSVRLAFVAALQHLPARQRAVLLLRDVLRWRAAEVADLLDTSVAAVNSALQRARATLEERAPADTDVLNPLDDGQRQLLERYLEAFERYDMAALRDLLAEDATQTMPPLDLWLSGRDDVLGWMAGPGAECEGSRLVPTAANGMPAFGQYRRAASGDGHEPWALQVLEIRDGRIVGLNAFLDTARLFPRFGLPDRL